MRKTFAAAMVAGLPGGVTAEGADPPTQPASQSGAGALGARQAPNIVLLYYGFDSGGARDWTPESLKYYLGYYENRGTGAEKPGDAFFDTVLWMYRKSSRGHLFEAGGNATPPRNSTGRNVWIGCISPDSS